MTLRHSMAQLKLYIMKNVIIEICVTLFIRIKHVTIQQFTKISSPFIKVHGQKPYASHVI